MHPYRPALALLALLASLALSACAQPSAPITATATVASVPAMPATGFAQTATAATAPASLPLVQVYKSPTCGCCTAWVEHMQQAGFPVQVHETDRLDEVQRQLGVPYAKGSCHTARVDGYVIEGHVPPAEVQRLLAQRPDARGLVLPGMPAGSPGMEMPDGYVQPYTVELVAHDGSTSAWSQHGPR